MKILLSLITMLVTLLCFGQERQSAVWHFGYHYKMDFNSSTPEVTYYPQGQLSQMSFGPWASICDKNGNYQFSVHYNKTYDKDGNIMKGGEQLHGAPILNNVGSENARVWTPLIVPRANGIYWAFWYQMNTCFHGSMNENTCPGSTSGSINRAIIDMNRQNGYGEVIVQKELIDTVSARHLAVMMHQNNRDSWLVTHGAINDEFRAYLINDTGIVRTPVRTNVKPNYGGFRQNLQDRTNLIQHGVMIGAPNSELICACPNFSVMRDDTSCYLYQFNRTNGTLEYKQRLKQVAAVTGHAFSVDSKKLYFVEGIGDPYAFPTGIGNRVWQFALSLQDTASIQQSRNNIGRFYSRPGNLTTSMLALDGRVYLGADVGGGSSQSFFGRVENPNQMGINSNLNPTWYSSIGQRVGSFGAGFPVLNQSLLRNAYRIQAIASKDTCCLGDTINVYGYGAEADRFLWDPNPYLLETNLGTVRAVPTQNTIFTVKGWSRSDSGTASTSVVVAPKPFTPSIRWNGSDSLFVNSPVAGTKYYWYKNDVLIRSTNLPQIKADSGFVYKVRSVGAGCLSDASNLVVTNLAGSVPIQSLVKYAPNPMQDYVRVQIVSQQPVQLMLYSTQGQLLYSAQHDAGSTVTLPTAHLPSGLYRLRVQSGKYYSVIGLVRE